MTRLAYIVSRYPFVSHTFVLREVLALRRAGVHVDTYTVRRPGPEHLLSAEDEAANATTAALVPLRFQHLVAHAFALLTRPRRYVATLRLALGLRAPGPKAALWQVFYFAEAGLMWHRCRRRGTRHIHAHHANVASDVALLAAHLGGPRWSWSFTIHGPTEFFDVREHRLAQKAERALFVVCISNYARSQLMGLVEPSHWGKLRIVHCGVDPAEFAPPPSREPGPARELLSVGRAVAVKGHALLVEALADLAERGIDARLTVVGDGPELERLRALAEQVGVAERVEFAGAVGQDTIRGYYERADTFALPSFAEGIPVVLMEAMAMELPVVTTRITGIPELVEDGAAGLLVAPGSRAQLADALADVLTAAPERRAAMGRAGREKVAREFALERTTNELLALFREYLG